MQQYAFLLLISTSLTFLAFVKIQAAGKVWYQTAVPASSFALPAVKLRRHLQTNLAHFYIKSAYIHGECSCCPPGSNLRTPYLSRHLSL